MNNLPRYITVKVTEDHISHGVRRNGNQCPIRRALWEMEFRAPKVPWNGEKGVIRLSDGDTRYEWDIPPVAFKWLVAFDRGDDVKPLTFRLDRYKAMTTPVTRNKVSIGKQTRTSKPVKKQKTKGHLRPVEDI